MVKFSVKKLVDLTVYLFNQAHLKLIMKKLSCKNQEIERNYFKAWMILSQYFKIKT